MKIAFITTNLRGGGAEKALVKLAALLAGRGHRVQLILLEHVVEHALPVDLSLVAVTPRGRTAPKGWWGKRRAASRLRALLAGLTSDGNFDLVVSTLPFCDEVVALADVPGAWFRIANTLSAEIALLRRSNPGKAERRLARYRQTYDGRNLVAVSDGVAEDLRGELGLARANVVRIYNAFDPGSIRTLAAAADPELPREPYVIHVGRFTPQKRHDLLLEALRISALPHRLVLLAARSSALEGLIARYGMIERVTVAGFRPNPYPWIAGADLLVLCSDHEGMPNVLVEALICGTRVVSTDCPSGPREVLRNELARYLVPRGDAVALAEAMRAALAAPPPEPSDSMQPFMPETVLAAYEELPARWRAAR